MRPSSSYSAVSVKCERQRFETLLQVAELRWEDDAISPNDWITRRFDFAVVEPAIEAIEGLLDS